MRMLAVIFVMSILGMSQPPAEVPVDKEPHHHLVFENEYVRVFKVEVAPHEATLVHRHTRDYVVVTIGDAEVTNAVVGKEPKRWSFKDGDVTFLEAAKEKSFAHKAVNESEQPFVNYTIEVKHQLGDLLCSPNGKKKCRLPIVVNADWLRVERLTIQTGKKHSSRYPELTVFDTRS